MAYSHAIKLCAHCRCENPEAVIHCRGCGGSIFIIGGTSIPTAPVAGPRMVRAAIMAFLVSAIWGFSYYSVTQWNTARLAQNLAAELNAAKQERSATAALAAAAHQRKLDRDEAAFQAQLRDPAFLSGQTARERHEKEWVRRVAHDSEFARSPVEKTLLKMQQLAMDPASTAQFALQEVARLAAPPESRVEVNPVGDRFDIRVAFRMSALSATEAGAVTKHHTPAAMREEAAELSARVIKDLLTHCGSSRIKSFSVSCNHATRKNNLPELATAEEYTKLLVRGPVTMTCLYRVSLDGQTARAVPNWREIPLHQVISRLTVGHDGFTTLTINVGSPFSGQSDRRDPPGQLQF